MEGTLELRFLYEGSKSEGTYPFLLAEGEEYKLGRQDVLSANDDFFLPFNGKRVRVEGEVRGEFITVTGLTELTEEPSVPDVSDASACLSTPINEE